MSTNNILTFVFYVKNLSMKNISLYVIVDTFFKFVLLFFFNLIWCIYFISPISISIIVCTIVSIGLIFIFNYVGKKRNAKKFPHLKQEQHIQDVLNSFLYMSSSEILSFFYRLAKTKHPCQIENNYLIVETKSLPIILFPIFKSSALNSDDALALYKLIKHKKLKRLIILTNKIDPAVQSIAKNFKYETIVLDHRQTYFELLQKYEYFPEVFKQKDKKQKQSFKQILPLALNKKKTKGYLLSALFLFFSSFFVIYKVYYLIFASILTALALISYFNPKFNSIKKINVLE